MAQLPPHPAPLAAPVATALVPLILVLALCSGRGGGSAIRRLASAGTVIMETLMPLVPLVSAPVATDIPLILVATILLLQWARPAKHVCCCCLHALHAAAAPPALPTPPAVEAPPTAKPPAKSPAEEPPKPSRRRKPPAKSPAEEPPKRRKAQPPAAEPPKNGAPARTRPAVPSPVSQCRDRRECVSKQGRKRSA